MERRGQRFLVLGVIFNSAFLILDRFIVYKSGCLDFVIGLLLGLALIFLLAGLFLTFKSKKKSE